MTLLLFDIDGTLVSTGLAGGDAMGRAFEEIHGVADAFAGIEMSGKTDPAILREAWEGAGIDLAERDLQAFHDSYVRHLQDTLEESGRPRHLKPGLPDLLETIAARDDVVLGLLTGNFVTGAQLKLESFGILHYFRIGAYGSDNEDRKALVPVARLRARQYCATYIAPQRVFVIGDTPRDIDCARAHDVQAVAVATGNYSFDDLQTHQPDLCFADLSDQQAVLESMGLGPETGEG
jgi:phosphoglycolate phosphatase-like HAD superfamily hydrolase